MIHTQRISEENYTKRGVLGEDENKVQEGGNRKRRKTKG